MKGVGTIVALYKFSPLLHRKALYIIIKKTILLNDIQTGFTEQILVKQKEMANKLSPII